MIILVDMYDEACVLRFEYYSGLLPPPLIPVRKENGLERLAVFSNIATRWESLCSLGHY